MSTRRIASQHTDISRVALERRPGEVVAGARVPAAEEFAALLQTARQRPQPEGAGRLQQAILDFVMPRVSDPAILRSDRRVAILESLLSDILPHLDDGNGAGSLAVKVVGDEISRQRHLLARLQQGIAA
jgi:hypothetical protein